MSSYFRDPLLGVPSAHRAPNPPSLEPLRYLPPSQAHRQHLASPSQPYFQHYPSDDAHYTHYQPPQAQRTDFTPSPPHRPSEERGPQGITCSSCKSWVSLDELGGHVCQTRYGQGDLRIEVDETRGKDGHLDRSPPDTPGTPSSQPVSSPASTAASSILSPSGTRLPFFEKYQKLVDSSSPGIAGVGAYSRSPNLSPRLGAPSLPHAPVRSPTSPLLTSTSAPNLSVPVLDRQNSFPAPSVRQRPPEPSQNAYRHPLQDEPRYLEPSYLSASPPHSRNAFLAPRSGDRSPSLKPSRSTPADLSTYTSQPPTRPSPRLNDPVADLDACLEDLRIMAKGEDDDGGAQEMLDDFINGRKTDSIGYSDDRGPQIASAPLPVERTAKEQCTLCARHLSPSDVDVRRTSNRQPLCRSCYVERFLPKCRKCEKRIEGGAVTSSDGKIAGKYHRDCFNCFDCAAPFPDGEFYVCDGKPFCQLHYHTLNGSLCANAGCGEPIEGSCVSLVGEENGGGGRYHPHCFNCSTCHSPLLEHHFVVGRLPFCEAHAVRRRPQKAGTASEREERAKKRQTIITRR
ncbi:hypothetical protein JCM10296v2_002578 [Rhodotorula toruloides]